MSDQPTGSSRTIQRNRKPHGVMSAARRLFIGAHGMAGALGDQCNPGPIFVSMIGLMLLLALPSGILSGNEEYYFAYAKKFLNPDWVSGGAVIGNADHMYLFSFLVGGLIEAFGFAGAQMAACSLLILFYAFALTRLFRQFSLSVLDAALIIVVFALFDQQVFGGEFLFQGVEPKTLAYPFVILALADGFDGRLIRPAVLLAIATTLHFLVGGYWFAFMFLFAVFERGARRPVFLALLTYVALCIPVLTVVLIEHYDQFTAGVATGGPSPSWIFSMFRMPLHVAPFASLWTFGQWAPGIALLLAMTVICAALAVFETGLFARLARFNLIPSTFLILALVASFFDRDTGRLGPFFLFRPTSLVLLLWLIQISGFLRHRIDSSQSLILRASALALFGIWLLPQVGSYMLQPFRDRAEVAIERQALYDFVSQTADAVFAIDPALEHELLSFERMTERPSFVMFKFSPTRPDDLVEWYRRIQLREDLFHKGCEDHLSSPAEYLVVLTENWLHGSGYDLACHEPVFRSGRYAVLRVIGDTSES